MKNLCPHIFYPEKPLYYFWFDDDLKEIVEKLDIICVSPNEFLFCLDEEGGKPKEFDFFELTEISDDELKRVQNNDNCIILFDWVLEGYSSFETNMFDLITRSAKRFGIPGEKIFILLGDVFEETNYKIWQEENSPDFKMNVFSFMYFERLFSGDPARRTWPEIEDTVQYIEKVAEDEYRSFLCLNQRKRAFRNLVCYKIFYSSAYKDFYISYDKMDVPEFRQSATEWVPRTDLDLSFETMKKFTDSSPAILDRSDFEVQWSLKPAPLEFYKKTICSVVNETHYESFNKRNLFYTEKTFRAMVYNQPLMIIGQSGANKSLDKFGYKTYDAYFDLSFDDIIDNYDRLNAQIKQLEELSKELTSMNKTERIKWYLKGVDVIHHNKLLTIEHPTIDKNIKNLVDALKKLIR